MAKKETTKKEVVAEASKLIIAPRLTEKASLQANHNAYTFEVENAATKHSLIAEIKKTYKVTPLKVNIVSLQKMRVFVRGRIGETKAMKKAVVFLKKGDTIKLA